MLLPLMDFLVAEKEEEAIHLQLKCLKCHCRSQQLSYLLLEIPSPQDCAKQCHCLVTWMGENDKLLLPMEESIHFLLPLMMDMLVAEKVEEAIHLQPRHCHILLYNVYLGRSTAHPV